MAIEIWVPLELVQYDEINGTSPANMWNGIPTNEDPFDSDRITRLVRVGMVLTGVIDSPGSTGVRSAQLTYPDNSVLLQRNAVLPVKWVNELCNPENGPGGEVTGWECVLRINETNYDSVVPPDIKGADGVITWRTWRSPNQDHYVDAQDFYYVPTTAWDGFPLIGSEAMRAHNLTGVNAIPRSELNSRISDGTVTVVPQP